MSVPGGYRVPKTSLGRTRLRFIAWFCLLGLGGWVLMQMHLSNIAYFVVTSESMEPTIKIGDKLVMRRPQLYKRGDIVVFDRPDRAKDSPLLVKRIVAMYPDQVALRDGQLYVNGYQTDPPQGSTASNPGENNDWRLKQGDIFLAGDNRAVSDDSRDYGPVPTEALHGTVRYKVISRFRWQAVQ